MDARADLDAQRTAAQRALQGVATVPERRAKLLALIGSEPRIDDGYDPVGDLTATSLLLLRSIRLGLLVTNPSLGAAVLHSALFDVHDEHVHVDDAGPPFLLHWFFRKLMQMTPDDPRAQTETTLRVFRTDKAWTRRGLTFLDFGQHFDVLYRELWKDGRGINVAKVILVSNASAPDSFVRDLIHRGKDGDGYWFDAVLSDPYGRYRRVIDAESTSDLLLQLIFQLDHGAAVDTTRVLPLPRIYAFAAFMAETVTPEALEGLMERSVFVEHRLAAEYGRGFPPYAQKRLASASIRNILDATGMLASMRPEDATDLRPQEARAFTNLALSLTEKASALYSEVMARENDGNAPYLTWLEDLALGLSTEVGFLNHVLGSSDSLPPVGAGDAPTAPYADARRPRYDPAEDLTRWDVPRLRAARFAQVPPPLQAVAVRDGLRHHPTLLLDSVMDATRHLLGLPDREGLMRLVVQGLSPTLTVQRWYQVFRDPTIDVALVRENARSWNPEALTAFIQFAVDIRAAGLVMAILEHSSEWQAVLAGNAGLLRSVITFLNTYEEPLRVALPFAGWLLTALPKEVWGPMLAERPTGQIAVAVQRIGLRHAIVAASQSVKLLGGRRHFPFSFPHDTVSKPRARARTRSASLKVATGPSSRKS